MEPRWRKSSFSEGANNCVELAHTEIEFGVRDSKNANGSVLTLTARQGLALLNAIKTEHGVSSASN